MDHPGCREHCDGADGDAGLQPRNDGETSILNLGKYNGRFAMADDIAKLPSRTCIYGTHRIATFLLAPIWQSATTTKNPKELTT